MKINEITKRVIGAAIDVHRELGLGLLESAYEQCLARELTLRKIPFEQQKPISLKYKGEKVDAGFRLDFLVAGSVLVELKSVESILPLHEAQLLTYLRLAGKEVGLLINFNAKTLRSGIKRIVHQLKE